ncbi:hypothetical protein J6590_099298, partial [Homalodisca vitripennis]
MPHWLIDLLMRPSVLPCFDLLTPASRFVCILYPHFFHPTLLRSLFVPRYRRGSTFRLSRIVFVFLFPEDVPCPPDPSTSYLSYNIWLRTQFSQFPIVLDPPLSI